MHNTSKCAKSATIINAIDAAIAALNEIKKIPVCSNEHPAWDDPQTLRDLALVADGCAYACDPIFAALADDANISNISATLVSDAVQDELTPAMHAARYKLEEEARDNAPLRPLPFGVAGDRARL